MERYLADEPVDVALMQRALRQGTITLALVPVLCGSAFKNKGIQQLLDAVVDYLPSPSDIPPVQGLDAKGQVVERPRRMRRPWRPWPSNWSPTPMWAISPLSGSIPGCSLPAARY